MGRKNIPPNETIQLMSVCRIGEENAGPITELVKEFAPEKGKALEIASGTGQHIVKLAVAKPSLDWQPSEIDQLRIASIQRGAKRKSGQFCQREATYYTRRNRDWMVL